jgi:hypothetical protein
MTTRVTPAGVPGAEHAITREEALRLKEESRWLWKDEEDRASAKLASKSFTPTRR